MIVVVQCVPKGLKIVRCAGVTDLTKRDKENFDAFNTPGNARNIAAALRQLV